MRTLGERKSASKSRNKFLESMEEFKDDGGSRNPRGERANDNDHKRYNIKRIDIPSTNNTD